MSKKETLTGEQRRAAILPRLSGSKKPISASKLAQEFSVSRQIIVGDIALLRASGSGIIATARGYLLEEINTDASYDFQLVCQHQSEDTEEEMKTIVDLGGEVINVIVEHPLYGELLGNIHVKSCQEVEMFMKRYQKQQTTLLSSLTQGIHLHTIRCENEQIAGKIKQSLSQKGFLYLEKDQ